MSVLDALGDPAWFTDDWPATPYHRVGSASELRTTMTWSALDTILNDQGLQAPAFRMARNHQLVPAERVPRPERHTSQAVQGLADPVRIGAELADGATLVLQGLQRFWPPLADTCRRLAADIGHPVFVNAYLTPRAEQGFGAHHDPYHAWLTQVSGSKSWRLWAPDHDPAKDPADLEVVLAEGDVLWIPRGWWHSGSSGSEPSLHLTFTVWATKLDAVLRALLAEVLRDPGLAPMPVTLGCCWWDGGDGRWGWWWPVAVFGPLEGPVGHLAFDHAGAGPVAAGGQESFGDLSQGAGQCPCESAGGKTPPGPGPGGARFAGTG
ncbi:MULTISPECIES: JmjC domain-containing protein [unclassified Streptomyces]|uniref:JmjC domain-containing protein n=1 Tax=unclassified Streptomyces TaxID=2593676 RepID=UPI001314F24F|nr:MULTISPECIES: cupin domain-containing protein [unclassified Streptomyces]